MKLTLKSKIESYIEQDNENSYPIFHLINHNDNTHISISLFRNTVIKSVLVTEDDKRTGYSEDGLHLSLDFEGALSNYALSYAAEIKNIIILGAICESLCKAEIPITKIIDHLEPLNNFVNSSLSYYGYPMNSYKFDFHKARTMFHVSQVRIEERQKDKIMKKYILPGKTTTQGICCFGIMYITEKCIYFQTRWDMANQIVFPDAFYAVDDDSIKRDISTAMLWILFAFNDIYIERGGGFQTFNPNFIFNLSLTYFYNCKVLNPYYIYTYI